MRWSTSEDDENLLMEYAWYRPNAWNKGEPHGHKIGTKQPNALGLYDMHGNVWEWVEDLFSPTYYRVSPSVDPKGPDKGSARCFRGGSFYNYGWELRSAYRCWARSTFRDHRIGFRLVRNLE